jgi:hypothetical protein
VKTVVGVAADDAGHVIGRQLGGSRRFNQVPDGNIFPQNLTINRGAMVTQENSIMAAYDAGDDVCGMVTLVYEDDNATRPSNVIYTIMKRRGNADFRVTSFVTLPNPQ